MPTRKPTALKKLAGTYRADRSPEKEPMPDTAVPLRAPAGLSKEARAFWRKYAPELQQLGLLTAIDLGSFAMMCHSWGFALQAAALVIKDGMTRLDENKVERKHPGLQVFRDCSGQYMAWAREFGMTPKSRSGIDVSLAAPDPISEFMSFLHRGAEMHERNRTEDTPEEE